MSEKNTHSQPWLAEKNWQLPITSGAKTAVRFSWIFAIIWNAVAIPVCFLVPDELAKENYLVLLVFLFPLVGIFIVRYAIKATREWRTYGVTELSLDPFPGAIGGDVGGSILISGHGHALTNTRVQIEQMHSYISGSGKNRSRKNTVEWEAAGPVKVVAHGIGKKLHFRFGLPDGLPISEKKSGNSYRYWQLRLNCEGKVPLDRVFEIPVFATKQNSQDLAVNTTQAGAEEARNILKGAVLDPEKALVLFKKYRLTLEHRDGWLRLLFSVGRQKIMAFMLFLFGAACVGVSVFIPENDFGMIIFRLVFGLVGLPLILGSFYLPFNSLDLRISRTQIIRERFWFGMRIKRQEVIPSQLTQIEVSKGASSTSGNKTTQYYRLIGKGSFGKIRLAEGVTDKALITAIRNEIMGYAGLKVD